MNRSEAVANNSQFMMMFSRLQVWAKLEGKPEITSMLQDMLKLYEANTNELLERLQEGETLNAHS